MQGTISWQLERIIEEIEKITGTADGYVHIPSHLLRSVAKQGYNDGQLDAMRETLERLKEAKEESEKQWAIRIENYQKDEAAQEAAELPEGS